jgi:hypothetical protein
VVVAFARQQRNVAAGASAVLRLVLSEKAARSLRRALSGRTAISVLVQVTATADAGEPTSQTLRLSARA